MTDDYDAISGPNCLACRTGFLSFDNHSGVAALMCKYLPGNYLGFHPSSEEHAIQLCMMECNDFHKNGFLFKSRITRINEMITIGQMPW